MVLKVSCIVHTVHMKFSSQYFIDTENETKNLNNLHSPPQKKITCHIFSMFKKINYILLHI